MEEKSFIGEEADRQKLTVRIYSYRSAARIISIIFIIGYLLFFVAALLMSNQPPSTAKDFIILALCLVYIAGLLIAFWNEGLGGFISVSFPVLVFIYALVYYIIHTPLVIASFMVFPMLLILMVPCILFLMVWQLKRKLKSIGY